jgi:hypothetical protein
MMWAAKARQRMAAMYTRATNELLIRVIHVGRWADRRIARRAAITRWERYPPPRHPRVAMSTIAASRHTTPTEWPTRTAPGRRGMRAGRRSRAAHR